MENEKNDIVRNTINGVVEKIRNDRNEITIAHLNEKISELNRTVERLNTALTFSTIVNLTLFTIIAVNFILDRIFL